MIESRGWNVNKDETVHKAAGSAHLRKYSHFFETLAEKFCFENSSWEYTIEGPLRLVYKVSEDINLHSLAETESTVFTKLLTSVAGTCREIRLLKAEADKHYQKFFIHGERCSDNKDFRVKELLNDFQSLSAFVNRIFTVTHLTVRQLSNIACSSFHEIYLPVMVEHLLDLLSILVTIDELVNSQLSIVERWKKYQVQVKSVIHNSDQVSISEDKIFIYEKMLKDLYEQLLSKNLFSKVIEHVMDINKNSVMYDHLLLYLRNVVSDIESKVNDAFMVGKNWMRANVGIVLLIKLFGTHDKKLLRRIIDINKKLYGKTLVGNVVWLPNDFLAQYVSKEGVPQITATVGEKLLILRTQKLLSVASNLIHRSMLWCTDMLRLQATIEHSIASEIERRKNLLLEILNIMQQIRENVYFITNFHGLLSKAISRSTVQIICRLIEVQKSLETTFYTLGSVVVQSQNQVIQQLTYQTLAVLEKCRKNLIQNDKAYSKEKLDSLSLVTASIKLVNGPGSADRRLIIRCAMACAYQLTDKFKEEDIAKLRYCLDTYDTIIELYDLISECCDYSILLNHQSMLPAYLSITTESSSNMDHMIHLFNAFTSAIVKVEPSDLSEKKISEQKKILIRNVLEPTCREIETALRLHVHAHLKLDSTNPFYIGAKDSSRVLKCSPLLINNSMLNTKRFVEHYLDYTFYNLTTVALHDWRTYRTMHALANYKYGLETVQNHLPTQTLEQGLDALEIMRNIHVFVAKYDYNLHTQTFIEHVSASKHLNTIGIRHAANSIRTHGTGILSTTVNFVYQFLQLKLHTFSQFLYDEHIKSRLIKDVKFIRSQLEKNSVPYPYERAEKFQKGIRKLGMTQDGQSYLDQFRQLITQIGNALGYVRLMRSADLHASSNAVSFLPDINASTNLGLIVEDPSFSEVTRNAAKRLEFDIAHLVRNFTEGMQYFKLLTDVFASAFRDSKNYHLHQFYSIIPPLTLSFVDNSLSNKEKLSKKNKTGASFTDDGFAVGVAYITALLNQNKEFDNLNWMKTVTDYFDKQKSGLLEKTDYDDEKLQQTRALTMNRLEERYSEFQLLYYSLSGARVFFKQMERGETDEEKQS